MTPTGEKKQIDRTSLLGEVLGNNARDVILSKTVSSSIVKKARSHVPEQSHRHDPAWDSMRKQKN